MRNFNKKISSALAIGLLIMFARPLLSQDKVGTTAADFLGIAVGARTGLANMVVVGGFCGAMFFAPALTVVPAFATAPALIVVGGLMAAGLARIDWENRSESVAAFVTALAIPLTFSISHGMALGVGTYLGTKALGGRADDVSWIMWALGAVFLLRYLFIPVD